MLITPIGLLIIPLGILLSVIGRRALFWAVVCSAPFFVVSIVKCEGISSPISPTIYFSALFIVRKAINFLLSYKKQRVTYGMGLLLLCLLVWGLSLFMPALLAGQAMVATMDTWYGDYHLVPLAFTKKNITQFIYPLFMGALFLSVAHEMRDTGTIKKVLRLVVALGLAILFTGFFFQYCEATGHKEILGRFFLFFTGDASFRNLEYTFGLFPRMYSLAGEPGYTAAYLLLVLGMCAAPAFITLEEKILWSKNINRLLCFFILLGILLTGGTTGILGIGCFIVALLVILMIRARNRAMDRAVRRFIFLTLAGVALLFAVMVVAFPVFVGDSFISWMLKWHISKITAESAVGSGRIRMATMIGGIKLFMDYPLLGVGYGSHRTAVFLVSLLSNVGIMGTLIFLAFNIKLLYGTIHVYRFSIDQGTKTTALMLILSFLTFFATALIAQSMVVILFGYYWLLLAMMSGSHMVYRNESSYKKQVGI